MEKFCPTTFQHLRGSLTLANTFQQWYICRYPLASWFQLTEHRDDARVVPAGAAACVAILRCLQALFVAIFENRFDTYSADPLDY